MKVDSILYLSKFIFIFFFNHCNILFCCTTSCCCYYFFNTCRSTTSCSRLILRKKKDRFYIKALFDITRFFASCIGCISSCTTRCSTKSRWTATTTTFISILFWLIFISRWRTTVAWLIEIKRFKLFFFKYLPDDSGRLRLS